MHWTVDIFSDWNETVQTSVLEGRLSRFVMAVPMQDQLLVLASRVSCGPAGQRCIVQRQEDICWWNMMKYDQIQNCFQQKLGAVFSRSCECIYEVLIRLYPLNIWSLLPAVSKTCFICGRWPSNICRLFSTTLHCSINRIPYIPILLLHCFFFFKPSRLPFPLDPNIFLTSRARPSWAPCAVARQPVYAAQSATPILFAGTAMFIILLLIDGWLWACLSMMAWAG